MELIGARRSFSCFRKWVLLLVSVSLLSVVLSCKQERETEYVPPPVPKAETGPLVEAHPELPFGAAAIFNCRKVCSLLQEDAKCNGYCKHYSVENFASSPLLSNISPKDSTESIVANCKKLPVTFEQDSGQQKLAGAEWKTAVGPVMLYLFETPRDESVYWPKVIEKQFYAVEDKLKKLDVLEGAEPELESFDRGLRLALCLRKSLHFVQLAILKVASKRDLYSERYYRRVEQGILDYGDEVEGRLSEVFAGFADSSDSAEAINE